MTSPTQPNGQSTEGGWASLAHYIAPPIAGSIAIIPAFHDMVTKSAMQKGQPLPTMTVLTSIKGGIGAGPTVGTIVGTQMILQSLVEKVFVENFPNQFAGDSVKAEASLTLASSVLVGGFSSPFLAIYNGKTMMPPWSIAESWSKFSLKQAGAITLQETGFVAGLTAGDLLSVPMKQTFGDNKVVDYSAAAIAGALGSLVGHAGNTALTRWQSALKVDSLGQLAWGSLRKARGNAVFAVAYKFVKEALNPTAEVKK